jgi:hypothetical protein
MPELLHRASAVSLAVLAVIVASCVPAEDKCDATTIQTVQLTTTLIPDATHNAYYLATPSTARSACDAHYQLTFRWAAAARAATDTTMPPLNNLDRAFHVNVDSLFWYHANGPVRTLLANNTWLLDVTDHYATATSPQSLYYMRTGLTSGLLGDSVSVSGTITYYPQ